MNFRFTRYSYWPFVWFPTTTRYNYGDSWSARGYDPSWNYDYPAQPNAFLEVAPTPDVQVASPQGDETSTLDAGGASFTTLIAGVDARVDEGIAAFAAGDASAARRAFAAAVARDPSDPYARILYGWTWFAEGDPMLASASIRLALQEFPHILGRPLDVRALYRDRVALDAQLAALFAHVARHHEDRDARFLLGYVLFTVEQPQEAWDVLLPLMQSGEADAIAADLLRILAEILGVEAPVAAPMMPDDSATPPQATPGAAEDAPVAPQDSPDPAAAWPGELDSTQESSQNFDEAEGT
ncbi:MAG: hypothetical protein IT449_04040 [Phycisphaerales bacterium]|nr:hypothetical protein [Phycisphaerales bacterium]